VNTKVFDFIAGDNMKKTEKKGAERIIRMSLFLLFFIGLFFYIRLHINPRLYYQNQETIFFTDTSFFWDQLTQPGGFVSYIAAFLSQLFIFPWIGTLVVTFCFLFVAFLTRRLLTGVGGPAMPLLFLLPLVFLLMLHNNYQYPLSYTVALIAALFFFDVYVLISIQSPVLRFCCAVLFSLVLYLLTAGPFMLFVLLCVIYELNRRNFIIPVALFILASAVPWIAAKVLYLYTIKDTFFSLLPFWDSYKPAFASYAVYIIFPLLLIFALVYNRFRNRQKQAGSRSAKKPADINRRAVMLLLQYIIILLLMTGAVFVSFDQFDKTMLQASDDLRQGKWYTIIHRLTTQDLSSVHLFHYLYRAMYHTNRLPFDFFSYPYPVNVQDMLFSADIGFATPWIYSDFFWDIGLLNESEHWAFEALAIQGPTVWILKRLALINILKGEKLAAEKFLTNLQNTLFDKKWAQKYAKYLDNPELIKNDVLLSKTRANMTDAEFITINQNPYASLQHLFENNKKNKMVFEYLCMHDLLNVRLESFISRLSYLKNYNYVEVPRIFQEAVLAYMYAKKIQKIDLPGQAFSPNMVNRFKEFQRIYSSYPNKAAAQKEIEQKFGNTYWYYLIYRQPEQPSSTPTPGAGGKK
jgi:hypothetical protein